MKAPSRRLGVGGLVVTVMAAGAAAGLAAERRAIGRQRRRPDPEAREPFGALPGERTVVLADDGVPLHVEVTGPPDAALTVVFAHGYTNEMASWHYQRRDLSEHLNPPARLVFYDHRGHGRSGRGARESATLDQLGRDLDSVLRALAPTGPVVLVGHSMGGMTIMALAEARPELFGPRVVGVALVATSPGRLAEVTFGLPAAFNRVSRQLIRLLGHGAHWRPEIVDRGRHVGTDLAYLITRHFSFGSNGVSPALVELVERMVTSTPVEVIADFYPAFLSHDRLEALAALWQVQTLILVGEKDVLTPPDHSKEMAERLPDAELVLLADAGHFVHLERAPLVNLHLRALLRRAVDHRAVPGSEHAAQAGQTRRHG